MMFVDGDPVRRKKVCFPVRFLEWKTAAAPRHVEDCLSELSKSKMADL